MSAPAPATAFERALGAFLALRRCDKCGKALGSSPRKMVGRGQFHPACVALPVDRRTEHAPPEQQQQHEQQ